MQLLQLLVSASLLAELTTNTKTSAANLHQFHSLASPFILVVEISNIVHIRLRSAITPWPSYTLSCFSSLLSCYFISFSLESIQHSLPLPLKNLFAPSLGFIDQSHTRGNTVCSTIAGVSRSTFVFFPHLFNDSVMCRHEVPSTDIWLSHYSKIFLFLVIQRWMMER
jgi:hypothetical protein